MRHPTPVAAGPPPRRLTVAGPPRPGRPVGDLRQFDGRVVWVDLPREYVMVPVCGERTLRAMAECRSGCAACCIAPSISPSPPALPHRKAAGVRCPHLTADL